MSSEASGGRLSGLSLSLAMVGTLALLTILVWRRALELPLYGQDTFPLIASCQVESAPDLARVASSELMGGRFTGGSYWRPLTQLSFALDGRWFGLRPLGYHLVDLSLLAACAAGVALLALALLGPSRWAAALIGGLAFAVHPAILEVLPLPPRRADSLALLFTLLAATAAARRSRWLAALASLAAVASKETGAIAPLVVLALAALTGERRNPRERIADGWRASAPALALTAAFLALRSFVVGGLGGGARTSIASALGELPFVAWRYAELVFPPASPGGAWVSIALAVLVAAAWHFAARGRGGECAAARLALVWVALLASLTAVAGTYRAWYALPFVAPLALAAAAAAARALTWDPWSPVRFATGAGAIAFVLACQAVSAERWREIEAAGDAARAVLARFDAAVEDAAPGSSTEIDVAPPEGTTRGGAATQKAFVFADYSLQAYAELRFPGRRVRVVARGRDAGPPASDEVRIVLVTR